MTAATLPARPPRAVAPPAAGRLLWIEIERNAVLWVLPLLALLVYFDTYRTVGGYPPVWTVRALAVPDRLLVDFAAFAGGFSAWAGSREGRRKTEDLLGTTVRPAWARQLAALAGTMFWLVLAFLAAVTALYIQAAHAVIWGGPPLWPVAVGLVALVTICVVGFTAGALFPGRFTAPLVAVGAVVLHLVGTHAVNDPNTPNLHDLLSLGTNVPPYDMGVFYHVPLDVPIAQVMFMGGIAVAAVGVLALSPALRRPAGRGPSAGGGTGRWLRGVSAALVAAGVAASVTAYDLTGTAKLTAAGWEIPALHDAAASRPVPYTPDCASPGGGTAGFRVCVHPAFGTYLDGVVAALDPVAAEIAGLPGAPVRAEQVPNGDPFYGSRITGAPPVYEFTVTITWARRAPARAAGRPHQPGPDPVTTADLVKPPAPAGQSWRLSSGARLAWLHARSRRVPAAVVALAVCGGVLRAALNGHWAIGSGLEAQQIPLIIETGAAAAIAVTSHGPFGEPERATGRWLPYLRLGTALALTGLAIGMLQLAVTGASLNEGLLVLARNVLGLTGLGLLTSLATGGLLAWTLPLGYLAFAQYALLEAWQSPWLWPVRPPADRGAWIWACLVFAAGLLAFTVRGARTSLADNGLRGGHQVIRGDHGSR